MRKSGRVVALKVAVAIMCGTAIPAAGQQTPGVSPSALLTDSAAVIATVTTFHRALVTGDSGAAIALLSPDLTVLESGSIETMEEYRSHHLSADIAFARAVPSVAGRMRAVVTGDVAWVSSTSTTQGEYRGRKIDSAGAELMVLSRSDGRWRIRAIHWSSRSMAPRP